MADDIETQLAALEDKAPLTAEPGDDDFVNHPIPDDDAGQSSAATEADPAPAKAAKTEADPAKVEDPAKAADKLPLEEIEKRWNDQKAATAKERAERRAAQQQAEALQAQLVDMQRQMAHFQAMQQAAANPPPNPDEDIVGYTKHIAAQLEAERKARSEMIQRQQAEQQQTQFVTKLRGSVEDFEGEFKAEHKDYDQAVDYLLDAEQERLEMLGYPTEQAEAMTKQFAINSALNTLRSGKNPAQVAYALAQKMGYRPAGSQPTPGAPSAAVQAAALAAEKLAQVRNGQQASSRMDGGGSARSDNSLKSILSLKGAAFDDATEKFLRGE